MQAHEPGEELESGTHPGGNGTEQRPLQPQNPSYSYGHHAGHMRHPEGVRETRDEMVNLKHAYKEQAAKEPALPPSASWASRPSASGSGQASLNRQASSSDLKRTSSSSPSQSYRQPPSNPANNAPVSASTSSHAHSSSISSRLPRAQNHPLPPRPSSRAPSVDMTRSRSFKDKDRETIGAAEKDKAKAPLSDETVTPPQATADTSKPGETSASATSSAHSSSVIAPPTPPVSEPSSSTSTLQKQQAQSGQQPAASAFPPGLTLPSGRPLTPVSEFDRTLDTFGDGSFAFNLSAGNTASPLAKGKQRLSMDDVEESNNDQARHALRFDPDAESSNLSNQASRDGSPQRGRGAHLAALHGFARQEEDGEDPAKMSYQGPFDPFAFAGDNTSTPSKASMTGDSVSRSGSPFVSALANGKLEGPPGLSRVNTAASSQDGMAGPPGGVRGGPPPGLEEASRHRSRFGFARPGSTERLPGSAGMSHAGGSNSGMSIAVADLFKGLNGAPGVNGTMSPSRPDSAQSIGSGNQAFAAHPPPGIFSPSALNGQASNSASSGSTPSLAPASGTSVFMSNNPVPLPPSGSGYQDAGPTSPSRQKKSLADLFPGVDLAASFSATSTLPDALVKSLGISLEKLDLQATAAANGKLPSFAPLPLGQSAGLANLPLPPKAGSGHQNNIQVSAGNSSASSPVPPHQGVNGAPVLSHGGLPPGLGTSRQAQQTHAQNAQQAHQAHLAAQQAQAAAAAAAAAQHQHSQQQQSGGQHSIGHSLYGKPSSPSNVGGSHSANIIHTGSNGSNYGKMHSATSPPILPGTPGPYGDASSARFQDPAIVSFAGLNGFGQQHMHHNPYSSPYGMHGVLDQASPGSVGAAGQQAVSSSGVIGQGQAGGDFYSRYQPMPTPVQPQQPYNPYIPVGPVGMNGMPANAVGMNRIQGGQPMSPGGGFGMLRR